MKITNFNLFRSRQSLSQISSSYPFKTKLSDKITLYIIFLEKFNLAYPLAHNFLFWLKVCLGLDLSKLFIFMNSHETLRNVFKNDSSLNNSLLRNL